MFQDFKEISLCESGGEIMNGLKQALEGIMMQAVLMASYHKALIKEGMSEEQALEMTIAFQDSQVHAASMANLAREEQEKEEMFPIRFNGLFK